MTGDAQDLFKAYRLLREYSAWPAPGGWAQQTVKFLRALDYCDRVHVAFVERSESKTSQEARMQEEARKVMERGHSG